MLGLDTKVLVRFLVQDDPGQFERALQLIEHETDRGEQVLIALLVVLETEWVLRSRYGFTKSVIIETFSDLLDCADVRLEDELALKWALLLWEGSGADLADCPIGTRHRALGCSGTASFGTDALKLPGFVAP